MYTVYTMVRRRSIYEYLGFAVGCWVDRDRHAATRQHASMRRQK